MIGRAKIRGEDKKKKEGERTYETDHRHFLYKQYLRILAIHKPTVFVMENVKGLLSAEVKQQKTFVRILLDLQNPGNALNADLDHSLSYKLFSLSTQHPKNGNPNPKDYIVRSEKYGIPQSRHRIIILGIRSDIFKSDPELLSKKKPVSINSVIGDLPKLRGGLSKQTDSAEEWYRVIKEIKNPTWFKSLSTNLRDAILRNLKKINTNLTRGQAFLSFPTAPKKYNDWYVDNALAGVCNHEKSRTYL